ncbi:MAG: hypothetical protein HC794_05820 [Nitrospiraceae bacterium]|nr:hypothetical protein [Nitrospiraceae bacterium]
MKIGVLVFPAVEELDFVGPWEMFGMWGLIGSSVRTHLVGQTTDALRCAKGLSVTPEFSFEDCPPLDVLLVPGGQGTREQVDNPTLMNFVKQQAEQHVQTLMSVCTGAFILHRAGLLLGRKNLVRAAWIIGAPHHGFARGYKVGRFSFNVEGGRCEKCQGDGVIKIEMHFLPDVYVTCETCKGKRYKAEVLEIAYRGKSISEVLESYRRRCGDFFWPRQEK